MVVGQRTNNKNGLDQEGKGNDNKETEKEKGAGDLKKQFLSYTILNRVPHN